MLQKTSLKKPFRGTLKERQIKKRSKYHLFKITQFTKRPVLRRGESIERQRFNRRKDGQFFRLTRPCRNWLLDSEHHDLPGISRSQGRGARDWCRAAPPRRLSSNKTSRALLEEVYGYSLAIRCPWCPGPPSPRISRRRSVNRNEEGGSINCTKALCYWFSLINRT